MAHGKWKTVRKDDNGKVLGELGSRSKGKSPEEATQKKTVGASAAPSSGSSAPAQGQAGGVASALPKEFYSEYAQEARELYRQLQNRQDFSYDPQQDALYQQELLRYRGQARLAQEDAVGQAAALTGGYGSSYAMTAGQQAYAGQMAAFDRQAAERYAQAVETYIRQGKELEARYNRAATLLGEDRERYDKVLESDRKEASQAHDRLLQWRKLLGHIPTAEELAGLGLTPAQIGLVLGKEERR